MRPGLARLSTWAVSLGILAGLGFSAAALVRAKRARLASAPVPTLRPTPVRVAVARRGDLLRSRRFLGRVEPWQESVLAARQPGRVERVRLREGESFEADTVLVELDRTEALDTLAAAAARTAEARALLSAKQAEAAALESSAAFWAREHERAAALAREGSLSPAQSEATEERRDDAAGRLAVAREALRAAALRVGVQEGEQAAAAARLAYTRLTNPWPGVVARRMAEPGDTALAGQALLLLQDLSRLRIRIDVPQEEAGLVRSGMEVRAESPNGPLVLTVDRIFPALGPERTLVVECVAPGGSGLHPGAYVEAELVWEPLKGVVLVPEDALVPAPGGGQGLFAVVDGRTVPRTVELLGRGRGLAAVSGLEEGAAVVRSTYLGWVRLAAGERVEGTP